MTEPNSSTLQKPDPDEPRTDAGATLKAARPRPQERLEESAPSLLRGVWTATNWEARVA
jgi:hypothetical protein